jgi:truncated hemoglobin YjbI
MKKLMILSAIALAVALSGCGKSAEMKKMEADLFASVNKMHVEGMGLMTKATAAIATVDETVAMCDKFVTEHPKEAAGHNHADLLAAKEKLSAGVTGMKEWMSGFKPYDEKMKHEDVIAQLGKSKEGIMKVKANLDAALAAAESAVTAHKAQADEIMAKLAKPAKKGAKK